MIRSTGYFSTPPVTLNLLIINVLFFMAYALLPNVGDWMVQKMGLFSAQSSYFRVYQLVTYMFVHGNFMHLFSNMFALWMFGRILEHNIGSRRFFVYYMVTGIGAGLIQLGVNWIQIVSLEQGAHTIMELARMVNGVTVGASGAVFGILLAFGMLHPNDVIMLLFPPIPLKAKYFVIIYGLFELFAGISGTMPGIAHYAHLGGMLWGWLLLFWWRRKGEIYY